MAQHLLLVDLDFVDMKVGSSAADSTNRWNGKDFRGIHLLNGTDVLITFQLID